MNNLAIIPARSGSKRIPKKNIKLFNSLPIIKYSIDAAIESSCFQEVMVSTDDNEIESISKSFGAKVPFLRSKENSNDFAGLNSVIEEVINSYYRLGFNFDNICCLLATAPFITSKDLTDSYNKLIKDEIDAVIPVVKFSYPIQRALKIENGFLSMIWPENYAKRSQDLDPAYHDCGLFYWIKTKPFLEQKKIFMKKIIAYEIPEIRVQDIDSEEDWKIAEMKYKIMKSGLS